MYFIYVDQVPSMEIFAHRVFWAVPFGAAILLLRKEFTEVKKAFLNTKILFYLTLSALTTGVLIKYNLRASLPYFSNIKLGSGKFFLLFAIFEAFLAIFGNEMYETLKNRLILMILEYKTIF